MKSIRCSAQALACLLAVGAAIPGSAAAALCTWTGATSGSWNVAGNWSCPGGPATGDDLVFPAAGLNKAMVLDIADLSVSSLSFPDAPGGYALTGAGNLTITGTTAITSAATGSNMNTLALTNPIHFGAAVAVIDTTSTNRGVLHLDGPLDLNGSLLQFVWASVVGVPLTVVNGVISGSGGLMIDGAGGDLGLELTGNNSFTGTVALNSGYLRIDHANALGAGGSAGNGTTIGGGATLILGADTVNEYLTLESGGGQNGNGMMQSNGVHTWGGPVNLNGASGTASFFNLLGSQIRFTGPVTGTSGFSCCNTATGSIALANTGNTFAGPSQFSASSGGTLTLLADNALSPNSAINIAAAGSGTLDMGAFSGSAAALTGNSGSVLKITVGQTLSVSGAVDLNGTTLNLAASGNPALGTVFRIIDKTGAGPVGGTFNGLAEGDLLPVGPVGMKISYAGGDGNDVTLTVQTATLSVVKSGGGAGTVTSNPAGINCDPTCSAPVAGGTLVTLTATPTAGSQFTGWLGPCTGLGDCTFSFNGATTARATFASNSIGTPGFDIDGNGGGDALTDGLLILRYLLGRTGADLNANAVGGGASRTDAAELGAYLDDIRPLLDVDGDGALDPLTDGLLIIRYLLGTQGDNLIAGALGAGATRTTAQAISDYIKLLLP